MARTKQEYVSFDPKQEKLCSYSPAKGILKTEKQQSPIRRSTTPNFTSAQTNQLKASNSIKLTNTYQGLTDFVELKSNEKSINYSRQKIESKSTLPSQYQRETLGQPTNYSHDSNTYHSRSPVKITDDYQELGSLHYNYDKKQPIYNNHAENSRSVESRSTINDERNS